MKAESIYVLDIFEMEHLISLGVDISKASAAAGFITEQQKDPFYSNKSYNVTVINGLNGSHEQDNFTTRYKTFTLQDMLQMMPEEIEYNGAKGYLCVSPHHLQYKAFKEFDGFSMVGMCYPTFMENAYHMLVWLSENGFIEKKTLSTPLHSFKKGDIITIYQQQGVVAEVETILNTACGDLIIAKDVIYNEESYECLDDLSKGTESIDYYIEHSSYRTCTDIDDNAERIFLVTTKKEAELSNPFHSKLLYEAVALQDDTIQNIRNAILGFVTIKTCLFDDEITPARILKKELRLSNEDLCEISQKLKYEFRYDIDSSIVCNCITVKDIMDYVEKLYKTC